MVCNCLKRLDYGFRRNDGKQYFGTFYEAIKIERFSKIFRSELFLLFFFADSTDIA